MSAKPHHPRLHPNPLIRHLLIAAGVLSVVLGLIGLLLPVVPTTPFLLLAGACFLRSSPRFYYWLLEHRWLGPYMRYYLNGNGMPRRAKVAIIAVLWLAILTSSLLVVPYLWASALMIAIGLTVSIYIARQPEPEVAQWEPQPKPEEGKP